MVPGHETHGNLALLQAKESAGDVFDLTPPDYWFPWLLVSRYRN